MATANGFHCRTCGQYHDEVPMSLGADVPYYYEQLPPDQREARAELTSDVCMIDRRDFFIRGLLEIPVLDGPGPFTWMVWTTLSLTNFRRAAELWETEGRESEPPYFGWLATRLPGYPETLSLKTHVHTRPIGRRPLVELEPTDHPLAVEQREGIRMARLLEIVELALHGGRATAPPEN